LRAARPLCWPLPLFVRLIHAGTGDDAIAAKANDLVAILAQCQAKDGYLSAYPATFYDRLRAHQNVWAPFYTYHKILAGMIDMYEHTGNKQALDVAVKMTDWADTYSKSFSDDEWQRVLLTEHGGMNEASFNLYAITGTQVPRPRLPVRAQEDIRAPRSQPGHAQRQSRQHQYPEDDRRDSRL